MIFIEHQVFDVTVQWKSLRKQQGRIEVKTSEGSHEYTFGQI